MSSKQSYSSELAKSTSNNPLSPEKVHEAFNGYQVTQVIYVAAKLGLADCLKNDSKSFEELAAHMDANENVLRHFMEMLLTLGIVAKDKNENYLLTPLGSLLRSDDPNSVLGFVLTTGEGYRAWGNLLYSVQTGKAAFDQTFKMSVYEFFAQNPEADANFNRLLKETTRGRLLPAVETYNFSKFTHFVDVGGNTGLLTTAILTKYPNLQATLLDQAHVVSCAEKILESAGVRDRCQIIGGDFFESIPTKGDLYIISQVLLNWDDKHALKILENCRAAMDPLAKLLIMDFVLPNQEITAAKLLTSLHSMVHSGRLMRKEDEFYALLSKAGFQSSKLIQTVGMISFIEADPK